MKMASVTQTKNQLSFFLEVVRQGETVIIMDRDIPVARLEPVGTSKDADPTGRLAGLERKGIIRPGTGAAPAELVEERAPVARDGASILRALLDERRNTR